ncbi:MULTISPECIES: condensation domain-containing protein [unclassified Streptomyces]|uniref:condensation domain-containing protein n=1 Tax=unclassified Streptomyces TaxID=2593676 RepID=UPI00136E634E|nr:condensation domain-containing protein [Streptomyces sp. SID2563]MYW12663.1 hypothetical protein [Streptomyces sp. SID2563]
MPHIEGPVRYPLSAELSARCVDQPGGEDMARFVMPLAWRIKGSVDSAALQHALDDVVTRHESLRTTVTCGCGDGEAGYQTVLPPVPVPLTEHQLATGPNQSRDDLAEELLVKLHSDTMSMHQTPLLRAALHRFDDQDSVLTILFHHISGDGRSTHLLWRDLAAFYRARTTGTEPDLPPIRQYGEYAEWQQEWLNSPKTKELKEFWGGQLANAHILAPSADHPDRVANAHDPHYGSTTVDVAPDEMAEVRARARSGRSSTWHVLIAAGALLAAQLSGETDVALMTLRASRDHKDFQETIGMFVDTMPLRVDLNGCETFRDVLVRARNTCLEAYRRPLPSRNIAEESPDFLQPYVSSENVPVLFTYSVHARPGEEIRIADGAEPVKLRQEAALNRGGLCNWIIWDLQSGGLRMQLEYPPERIDEGTAAHWTTLFRELMLRITNTPDQSWKEV